MDLVSLNKIPLKFFLLIVGARKSLLFSSMGVAYLDNQHALDQNLGNRNLNNLKGFHKEKFGKYIF